MADNDDYEKEKDLDNHSKSMSLDPMEIISKQ